MVCDAPASTRLYCGCGRCGHCKSLSPVWEALADSPDLKSEVRVGRVDCTKESALRAKYSIAGYPSLLFFNGSKIYQHTGYRSHNELLDFANGGWCTCNFNHDELMNA